MPVADFYKKDRFELSPENLMDFSHIIDEEIDSLNDSNGDIIYSFKKGDIIDGNVDLSSFKPKKELNPRVWPNGRINSKIRLRLLDIADDFIETLEVPWAKPKDIILTGSLANYNWSKYSDFDLHVVYDYSEVDEKTEFVREYFTAKKNIWNDRHEDLKIYGYPVELYAQDEHENHAASGVYSLEKDKWLIKPEPNKIKAIKLNKYLIKEKVLKIANKIDALVAEYEENKDDEYKVSQIAIKAKKLFDRIKAIRKEALKNGDEMSSGNIAFKCLRRGMYIQKLADLKLKTYDNINSIP